MALGAQPDVDVLSLSFDDIGERESVVDFLIKQNVSTDHMISKYGSGQEMFEALVIDALPQYLVYDGAGKLHQVVSIDIDRGEEFLLPDLEAAIESARNVAVN